MNTANTPGWATASAARAIEADWVRSWFSVDLRSDADARTRVPSPATSRAPTTVRTRDTMMRRLMEPRRRGWPVPWGSSEPVPDAPNRRQGESLAELLAELADVDVHRALVAVPARPPDPVEQL